MSEHRGEHAQQIDPRAHRVLADVSRVAVLETLRRVGRPLSIPEIAGEVGLHPNTVRAHLALLVKHGYAVGRTEERERPGRPRLLYTATAKPGDDEPDGDERRNYRLLAEVLISYLTGDGASTRPGDGSAAALAAGRAYGRRLAHGDARHEDRSDHSDQPDHSDDERSGTAQMDAAAATERIVALLQEAGFEPRLAPDGSHIDLHRCPFHELAEANPEVVCGVHLGLMQGALADLGAPITATSLRPFVRPGVCVATLQPEENEDPR